MLKNISRFVVCELMDGVGSPSEIYFRRYLLFDPCLDNPSQVPHTHWNCQSIHILWTLMVQIEHYGSRLYLVGTSLSSTDSLALAA